jgi:RNA recognition motif-containing protein
MNKLYVGNLSYSTMDDTLRRAFDSYGEVVSASVVLDRQTGQSRGFGFVEFASSADAQKAVDAMNGAELDGRTLNVSIARPKENSFGGGGGGGGGRSRGGDFGGGGGGGGGRGGGGGGGGRDKGRGRRGDW